jgi:hypothetical protein
MAVVIGVAALVLLALSVLIGPLTASFWLRTVYLVAQWTGPLLLLVTVGLAVRHRLADWVRRQLVDLAGPALITAMPPRTVLNRALERVFGEKVGHQEIVTALLGGNGRDLAARDTAVSKETSATIRLERIEDSTVLTELTWSHEFSGVRNNHLLVLFATWDRDIYTWIIQERIYPLFEAWRVVDEEELDQFASGLKDRLDVGISYRDATGALHEVPLQSVNGEEVALHEYDRFVRLPDWVDRKNLAIYQVDLHDLADPDHIVDSVDRLVLRASTVGSFDQGYVFWSPPHPCYVTRIVFDVRQLAQAGEKLVYQLVMSTLKLTEVPLGGTWTPADNWIEVGVDSWMLPGHGVTLLWRPVYGVEPQHDDPEWD